MVPLLPAQDHKRVGDGDTGPNTGGMGAYTPLPWLPAETVSEIVDTIVKPVAAELVKRDSTLPACSTRVWRSPRTAPPSSSSTAASVIPRRRRCLRCSSRRWGNCSTPPRSGPQNFGPLRWRDGSAVTVVLAAENYPLRPRTGDVITGAEAEGVLHAGTARREDGAVVSSGGRVLSVVGTGIDLQAARADAYAKIEAIRLPGSHFRSDIGLAAAEGRISI